MTGSVICSGSATTLLSSRVMAISSASKAMVRSSFAPVVRPSGGLTSARTVMLVPSSFTSIGSKPPIAYGLLPALRSACAIQSIEKRTSSSTVASSSREPYTR